MDRNEQLEAASELAATFDAQSGASEFNAVAASQFNLLSSGELVGIFRQVHGLDVRNGLPAQPEPTQPSTATSASDTSGQEGGVPLSLKDA